jgi:hypothetical protein
MKWPRLSVAEEPGDFMPIVFGTLMFLMSFPSFMIVLLYADRNSGVIRIALLVLLGFGSLLGTFFIVAGVRLCAFPGSFAYRVTRGRFFNGSSRRLANSPPSRKL